jgi:Tetracyclin repressor-like, C-terminal domain
MRERFDALFEAASEAVEQYLSVCPAVRVDDTDLAARIVVQIVESITHSLVIHPVGGATADTLVAETVLVLRRYLTRP